MNELITKLDFSVDIQGLKDSSYIFYCGPGINIEIANTLLNFATQGVLVFIVVDLDANNDYRGLNEIEEINKLFVLPNVTIKNSKGINVSFISNLIDFNYYLFPVSKILKSSPEGYNAAAMDAVVATEIFGKFFPELIDKEHSLFLRIIRRQKENMISKLTEDIEDMHDEEQVIYELLSDQFECTSVSKEEIDVIRQKVKEFPPEKPDLTRKINFISTYIQVVDFKFEGANWQSASVTIPKRLIPFKNESLKKNLDSKLKIFTKDNENESLKNFNKLKKEVDELRKEYFFRSKHRSKSIIKLNERNAFKTKFDSLLAKVNAFKDSLFELVQSQIQLSKNNIKNELYQYYLINPDSKMEKYRGNSNFNSMVNDEVDNMMREIKFPTVYDIIGELELTLSYLNFTYEDFEDLKFLEELSTWDKLSNDEFFMLFEKQKGFALMK